MSRQQGRWMFRVKGGKDMYVYGLPLQIVTIGLIIYLYTNLCLLFIDN